MTPLYATLIVAGLFAAADEKKDDRNARQTAEAYVAAALAGKVEDAAKLAEEGKSPPGKRAGDPLKEVVGGNPLKLTSAHASEKRGEALAVSEPVKLKKATPDGQDTGRLLFTLTRKGDKWLVKDIDVRSEDQTKERVKAFQQKNADAKEIPGKSEE